MISNNKIQHQCYNCKHIIISNIKPDKCPICGKKKFQKMTVIINK